MKVEMNLMNTNDVWDLEVIPLLGMCTSMMLFFRHWRLQNRHIYYFMTNLWRYFTYRDETSIFVIDVHLFYDEMAVVIEVYSFYDDLFSSLI